MITTNVRKERIHCFLKFVVIARKEITSQKSIKLILWTFEPYSKNRTDSHLYHAILQNRATTVDKEIMNEGDKLKEEGLTLFHKGELDNAISVFETAVSTYAAEQNPTGQAEMLNNIGVIHRLRGQHDASLEALTAADALCQETNDINRRAQVLGNMGDLYASMGDKETAARCYSDASALFAQDGDGKKQSQVLKALSLMRLRQGQWLPAMTHMEQSLAVKPKRGLFGSLFLILIRFALGLFGGK